MRSVLQVFVLLTLIALPAAAEEPAIPEQPSPAAKAFVARFSDAHLTQMLSRIGSRQEHMIALSQLHGQMLAAVFDAEIAKSVEKHGPEWRRNMGRAWTGLMTDDELSSLTAEGAASPFSQKYQSLSGAAGQRMQTLSQDLFRVILAETIQNTLKALAEPDDGTAGKDGPARTE